MKTIKIFATLFCLVAAMSVNAQTETTLKPGQKPVKNLQGKKASAIPRDQIKDKDQVKKEGVVTDDKTNTGDAKKVGLKNAPAKNVKPTDKTKMKQLGKPVKVTPK